ncbi:MAG: glycosyltransferase family 39 protein [Chloroflexi bacterium]|nr:glycosyltransferase family 39 protein [Chloroflexota bacterium]
MPYRRKSSKSLLLGLLAIGAGALGQNFMASRPFISDALFVFGVGCALLLVAFPRGGTVSGGVAPAGKSLSLSALWSAMTCGLFAIALGIYALSTLKGNLIPLHGWLAFLGGVVFFVVAVRAWDSAAGLSGRRAFPAKASTSGATGKYVEVIARTSTQDVEASAGRGPAEARRDWTPNWELVAIVVITLVAAYMRFPSLDSMPFGVWFDEAVNGLDSMTVAAGKAFPVYFEANFGRAALSFYVNALFFKLLGADLFALRLTAAVVGVLTIPVFYRLLRQFFGPHAALVGAFLLAVSRWHVNFSRIAFDAAFLPLLACASLYFLERGFRTKKATDFALGGLALGLGAHSYMAFRLFPVVIVLFLASKLIFELRSFRTALPGLVAFVFAAVLVASPLLKYAYDNPKAFAARTDTASVFAGKTEEQGKAALWSNIQKHLLMFNVRGDPNGRHNIPGEPMLDQLTAALFVLGFGYSLWNWRKPAHFAFVAMFGVMIFGGVYSVDFEAPQALRSIGVIPAVFAFAAVPLGLLWQALDMQRRLKPQMSPSLGRMNTDGHAWEWLSHALGRRPLWVGVGSLGVVVALAWVGRVNHYDYFHRQAASFASWNAFSTAETAIAYRLRDLRSADYDVYVSSLYNGHPTVRFLTPDAPSYQVFDVANGIPLRTQKKGVAIFLEPQQLSSYYQLKRYYPGGRFEEVTNQPYGSPPSIFDAYISREEIQRIQGVNGAYYPGEEKEGDPATTVKIDRPEFDWGKVTPLPPPFVGEWQGTLYAPQYGAYQFAIEGKTEATLYLDETALVTAPENPVAQVTLAKGNHAFRLTAGVREGDDGLVVKWQMPGSQMAVISPDYLFVPPVTNNGLLGKYYRTPDWQGAPALAQIDPSVAFYFHVIPLPRPYSVEWTGKVYAPTAGRYTFGTESISSSQLFIDGKVAVDNKVNNRYLEAPVNLQAGLHDITLRFQDRDSFSHVYLYWTMPGKNRELIPSEYLFPPQGSYPPPSAIPTPVVQQPAPVVAKPPPVATPTPSPAPVVPSRRVQPMLEIGRKGNGDGEFNEPRDVAVDRDGNIFVVDTANARVQKFDASGKFLGKFGKKGNGDGEFQEPLAIVIDSQNQVLVLDSTTGWVHRFDNNGRFKGKFAGPQGQFFHPRGMGIDGKDNIYVADTGGCRIVIYRSSGEYVGAFGVKGSGDGQLLEPVDVVVLEDGSLLVADAGNKRIQKFDASYSYVAQWRVPEAVAANGGHLAVSPDGSIYATEPERHLVVRYDRDMKPQGALGEAGVASGQFRQPVGLYVDKAGNLYVADTYNHRLQKFGPGQ